jgi:hypothetical protein
MNVRSETRAAAEATHLAGDTDRRETVARRHARLAEWLRGSGQDFLLVEEPATAAWLSGGGWLDSPLGPDHRPALLYSPDERWLLACDRDAAGLHELELPGLDFAVRTWPWTGTRAEVLHEAVGGRRLARDREAEAPPLNQWRRELAPEEQRNLKSLGRIVAHALEATCRSLKPDEAEREVAAQVGHRLLHRGVAPVAVAVAGADRVRRHGCSGYTAEPIGPGAVLRATGRRFGLHATASRTVHFGPPDEGTQQAHTAVCRVTGAYVASTWPDSRPREILLAGRRYADRADPDCPLGPPGALTGWAPVELALRPVTDELLQPGDALSCDTFLVTADGPKLLTPTESWPVKRIRIQGMKLTRPDILQR